MLTKWHNPSPSKVRLTFFVQPGVNNRFACEPGATVEIPSEYDHAVELQSGWRLVRAAKD